MLEQGRGVSVTSAWRAPEMAGFTRVPIEEVAAPAEHSTTRTTELVYRKELRPVLRTGATVLDGSSGPGIN
jgi:hypothetical protein